MDTNRIKSFVRSVFPFIESALLAFLAKHLGHVSTSTASYVLGFGGLGLSGLLHWLEGHFPWVGVFLGWVGAPKYVPALKKLLAAQLDQAQSEIQSLQNDLNALKNPTPATGSAVLGVNGEANPA